MMPIVKIFVLTLYASSTFFNCIQASVDKNFELEQYLALWHVLGIFCPTSSIPDPICEWYSVKFRYNHPGCFRETYGKTIDGQDPPKLKGFGCLNGSIMTVHYPDEGLYHNYSVTSYNQGGDLILRCTDDIAHSKIVSRDPHISAELRTAFENLAEHAGKLAVFIDPLYCPDSWSIG